MEYYFTKPEFVDKERKTIIIKGFEFSHIIKVLRKKERDIISVTDGLLNIYNCRIEKIESSEIKCSIINSEFNLFEPEINVTLYMSPLRNNSRFEFALEKAVELGVKSIQPVICEHTVSDKIRSTKKDRLQKIIIGAMGQSQRCFLPELRDVISFDSLISGTKNTENKIVMYESSDDVTDFEFQDKSNDVLLLIGPEGGFSQKEISKLNENHWKVKSLGKRKLRAETAVIVSLSKLINH